jgi:hypothetical protein
MRLRSACERLCFPVLNYKLRLRYLKALISLLANQRDVGQIRAKYRDLVGVDYASSAKLFLGPRHGSGPDEGTEGRDLNPFSSSIPGETVFTPNWPSITPGPLLLTSPVTASIASEPSVVAKSFELTSRVCGG